nr:copia protein [Tanacetum cinerariifolium]
MVMPSKDKMYNGRKRIVRFANNDFAVIAGYGYVVIGSMMIKKVYYVEGLGHNLFSIGKFCDKGLEVTFRKSTCFVRTEDGVDLLTGDRSSNLYIISLNDIALNSSSSLLAKASSSKRYVLVVVDDYSQYTWVFFLRLKDEASEVIISFIKKTQLEPGLSNLNETEKSSNPPVSKVSESSKKDLKDLFHDFYDEYFDATKITKSPTTNVETSNEEISPLEEVKVPSPNTQSVSNNMVPNVNEASTSHNVFNERLKDVYFDESMTFHYPSNVHAFYQPYPHDKKWTKDHPLHKIIDDLKSSVRTRGQIPGNIKTANVAEALKDVNKKDESNLVIRNKVRRVVVGYCQQEGIDYDDTFALVARIEAIRLFLQYVAHKDFTVFQMVVKKAFLNGILNVELYVGQPPCFVSKQYPDHVYALDEALYGLKQAPRAWYDVLSKFLIDTGFQKGSIDTTLFIKKKDKAILSGADNRLPMLEKDMYDSWKSRMELYMLNRQHGRMILESVEQGPHLWPTVKEAEVTRLKKYSELSAAEAIQADCDVKATNIILQGLPLEASLPDSELISSEVMEIVIPEVGGIDDDILLTIKDDILCEKLLNVNLLIAKIEALNDNPTPFYALIVSATSSTLTPFGEKGDILLLEAFLNDDPSFDFETKSSSISLNSLLKETNTFDNSLPEFETFCFDVEEINSGSTTTHSVIFLPEYEAFYDDHVKEISSGSPTTHLILLFMKYDCFLFKIEPNSEDFTKDVVDDISPTKEPRVHNSLPTHPTLQLNLKFQPSSESFFTYVVWIFLPFLVYSVAPQYLLSLRNDDTIFDPGICNYHSF